MDVLPLPMSPTRTILVRVLIQVIVGSAGGKGKGKVRCECKRRLSDAAACFPVGSVSILLGAELRDFAIGQLHEGAPSLEGASEIFQPQTVRSSCW